MDKSKTHKKYTIAVLQSVERFFEFLVPNHLIDEDGCLDEKFEQKISNLCEWGGVKMDDLNNIDCEYSVLNECEIQDDFDPDLPLVEDVINNSYLFA